MTDGKLTREELEGARARVPDDVTYRSFEAETLLLSLTTGQYHGLNPTGGRLLELLKERDGTIAGALEQLAEEYGVPSEEIADDIYGFCAALVDRGLIEVEAADQR